MRITLTRRTYAPIWLKLLVRVLALAGALLVMGVFFSALYGLDPVEIYKKIFTGGFGSKQGLAEAVVKTIPLMLCGAGLSLAFRAQFWNIGAEGQLIMGAIAAAKVVYSLSNKFEAGLIPLMFLAGFAAGALWGVIPAILKAKLRLNEVVITLMMNYIAMYFLLYLIYGPWRAKEEWGGMKWAGFPHTPLFPEHAWLPQVSGTRIHYPTLIIGMISIILLYIVLWRSPFGYEIRVVGDNPEAAKFAGISHLKVLCLVMILSGGLAGIAGVGEAAGIQHRLRPGFSVGYGYTAIITAWLGGLDPLLVIITSFLLGGLLVGNDMIQIAFRLPVGVIDLFNGTILFFALVGEFLTNFRIRFRR